MDIGKELGQPSAEEIAEKFCTEMLCNAITCAGCPIDKMLFYKEHKSKEYFYSIAKKAEEK